MIPRPISLRRPTLGKIISGSCTSLRRPLRGALGKVVATDLLWIREPYFLKAKFTGQSPTVAQSLNARPIFAENCDPALPTRQGLGPRRFARNLLRTWHRHHLVVTGIRQDHLHDITDAEIAAEGYRSRKEFAFAWNAGMSIGGGLTYSANPSVQVIDFVYVASPIVELLEEPA